MAPRQYWIGSFGPFGYNDANLYQDLSPHRFASDRPPIANDDVVRLQDLNANIQLAASANIDNPAAELAIRASTSDGGLLVVYQAAGGVNDEYTIYAWDSNPGVADVPYVVAGAGGGMWIAVAGKYHNQEAHFGGTAGDSEFEDDGTLVFHNAATVWNDLFFPMSSGRIGGANQPSWDPFQGNIEEYTFGVNDLIHLPSAEIAHSYLEGSDIEFHVHIVTDGSDVGDAEVNYEVEYTIGNIGAVMSGAAIITSGDFTIPGGTADRTHFRVDIDDIVGAAILSQAAVKMRFRRIARVGGGADPGNDPFVLMVGIHIQEDTVGSRTETTK
jgi:hypothetical protein